MTIVTDPQNLGALKLNINKYVEFDCSKYSNNFIVRRIDVRLRATGIQTYNEYINLIISNFEERGKLYKELTINVTNFFRDKEMWQIFMNKVIPLLIENKKNNNDTRIKIWSAGCSSGEEPITIAICFIEMLGKKLDLFDFKIIATDLKHEILEIAKLECYEESQFNEMKEEYKQKYFELVDNNVYRVRKEVIKYIQYEEGSILEEKKHKGLDIIFCRNTVIYFSIEAKPILYEEFHDCLAKNGFFVMGKTETLQGNSREKFKIFDARERIYIKE